ncbi:MAG: hypothetical protein MUP70_07160 [Candidatus Aminicenantes bacterium]|nr:hypothetical protein [Candidatus Aminicenantes bacterium]
METRARNVRLTILPIRSSVKNALHRYRTERECKRFKPYSRKKPKKVTEEKRKYLVYVVTENNEGWFFERVDGRWIFTPEDLG